MSCFISYSILENFQIKNHSHSFWFTLFFIALINPHYSLYCFTARYILVQRFPKNNECISICLLFIILMSILYQCCICEVNGLFRIIFMIKCFQIKIHNHSFLFKLFWLHSSIINSHYYYPNPECIVVLQLKTLRITKQWLHSYLFIIYNLNEYIA